MNIVWTNGCFDVLHRGHYEMLKYAKSLGNYLIVGIDSDRKVKQDKGESRPINNEDDRRFVLESIKYVDRVVVFDTPAQLEKMIKMIKPNFMVVGSDWKNKNIVGGIYADTVYFFDRIEGLSTTNILEKLK